MLEALISKGAVAWSPVREIRDRLANGTLTAGAVLPTCIGVAIASNLAAIASGEIYQATTALTAGVEVTKSPLLSNKLTQEFITLLAILPAGAVALLPRNMFGYAGKSAGMAAFLIVLVSAIFYSSIVSIAVYVSASLATPNDPLLGLKIVTFGSGLAGLVAIGFFLVAWAKAARLLGIGGGSSTIIVGTFLFAYLMVAFLLVMAIGAGRPDGIQADTGAP